MIGCGLTSPLAAPELPKPAPSAPASPAPAPANGGLPLDVGVNALRKIADDSTLGAIITVLFLIIGIEGVVLWKRQGIHDKALEARDKAHADALKLRDDSIEKTRAEWESQLNDLHEARLSLFREVMTALGASTAVIQMHASSTEQRTASAEKLSEKIAELIATSSASRAQFLALAQELARQGGANAESLQRISYKLPGGGA